MGPQLLPLRWFGLVLRVVVEVPIKVHCCFLGLNRT
jgi:hypothetical protein